MLLPGPDGSTVQASAAAAEPNLIRDENRKPGALDWQLTRVRADKDGFRSPWIEGYCSKQSVKAGETIDIMVSTDPPRRFTIEIFRMGYYGGRGARLDDDARPLRRARPSRSRTPGPKNLHECRWEPTTRLDNSRRLAERRLPRPAHDLVAERRSSPTGRATSSSSSATTGPPTSCSSARTTPGRRTTAGRTTTRSTPIPKGTQGPWADVSFDRPYGREAQHDGVVNDPLTFGSGEFLPFEFPLAYWLEQHGYDVTYCSNSDMLTPDRGLKCKAFLSVGHDEYWDIRQFRSVETAARRRREPAVPLGQRRLLGHAVPSVSSDGRPNRIMFRGGPYGGENAYARQRQKETRPLPRARARRGLLMGARNVEPVNGGGDWVIVRARPLDLRGHRREEGRPHPGPDRLGIPRRPAQAIPGLEVVAEGTAWVGGETPQNWTATIYPGPEGQLRLQRLDDLLGPGACRRRPGHTLPWSHWSRPHGPDERVQRITHNLLRRALRRDA